MQTITVNTLLKMMSCLNENKVYSSLKSLPEINAGVSCGGVIGVFSIRCMLTVRISNMVAETSGFEFDNKSALRANRFILVED